MVATLRGRALSVMTTGTTLRGGGVLPGGSQEGVMMMDVRMLVSWCSATVWLSVSGASAEPGDGFAWHWRMSWRPARMRSVDKANGIVTLVGNQDMVLQIRSACVSHTQTW